jgi:hypothetical protein
MCHTRSAPVTCNLGFYCCVTVAMTYSLQSYDFLRKVHFLTNTPLQTPVVRLAKFIVNPGNVYICVQ